MDRRQLHPVLDRIVERDLDVGVDSGGRRGARLQPITGVATPGARASAGDPGLSVIPSLGDDDAMPYHAGYTLTKLD